MKRMRRMGKLEELIRGVCQDERLLTQFWHEVDDNSNGAVAYSEWESFIRMYFPIVRDKVAASIAAARQRAAHPARAQAPMIKAFSRSSKPCGHGTALFEEGFRCFLIEFFYFNKLHDAFALLDLDLDRSITEREYAKHAPGFRAALGISTGLSAAQEFEEISKGRNDFTFTRLADWYLQHVAPGLGDDSWYHKRAADTGQRPLVLDMDVFTDLVLTAHYRTRVGLERS